MANKKSSPITTFIVGLAFIVGSWLTYTHFSVPMVEEANASESWPTVTGEITYSDILQSDDDGTTMYAAEINYDFTVENKSYSGNKISLTSGGTSTSSLKGSKKRLAEVSAWKRSNRLLRPRITKYCSIAARCRLFYLHHKICSLSFWIFRNINATPIH